MGVYDRYGNALTVETARQEIFARSVAHRGYNYGTGTQLNNTDGAPENTLPAYRLAKKKGFLYAECDVAFTSDGVAVLLHDSTIDRTSNGTGSLASLTFEQVRQYDFGYYNGSTHITGYEGYDPNSIVQIPTFEEFIECCKEIGLRPYVEMKADTVYTQAQIESLVDIVEEYGMLDETTWISFGSTSSNSGRGLTYLTYVKNYKPTARLGYLTFAVVSADATRAITLRSGQNEVFMDARGTLANSMYIPTSTEIGYCSAQNLPLETWGQCNSDTKACILATPTYIGGFTTNKWVADEVYVEALRESLI